MTSYICAIGTSNPPHRFAQMQIADFMADALRFDARDTRKLKVLYNKSGIDYRYSVLDDYGKENGDFTFFPNTPDLEPFPSVEPRMAVYRQHALTLSVAAIRNCLEQVPGFDLASVTHLITVSCTGMYAPGLDLELIDALGLSTQVQRTAVNFMGCYAAFNALKLADAMCKANPEARVLIAGVELCTIHFQKRTETDHLVSNAIFGDGAAAVLVQGQPQPGQANLEQSSFHCEVVSAGVKEMAWHIGDLGFEMTLSSYVPDMIKSGIRQLAESLLNQLKLTLDKVRFYAIHPGGRKILEVIEQELGMSREDNRYAYNVLRQYGNMSSVTVLFVLRELMQALRPGDHDENILSFAFGPGLTLESMLLRVHHV
jgi:alpha-pyrone synthase